VFSPLLEVTEHQVTLPPNPNSNLVEHQLNYLAAGPVDGPLLVFVHGWPELSLSWRHQLSSFAGLGFRCLAPDMRGYGKSSVYERHEDYALECCVGDLTGLLDSLGRSTAVWIGHDWGAGVVWALAAHHPQRCLAVANLCVPYRTIDCGLEAAVKLVNRDIYPIADFPAGQWEYMRHYQDNFAMATAEFDRDPERVLRILFRKGDPAGFGQPAATAFVYANRGWFSEGGQGEIPHFPIDTDVISPVELALYAQGLERNGFFGPDSYYMNHERNADYAASACRNGYLEMPVLFIGAKWDYTCDTVNSTMTDPMVEYCTNLTQRLIYSGHWMAQEQPLAVNAELAHWLATAVPQCWPIAKS